MTEIEFFPFFFVTVQQALEISNRALIFPTLPDNETRNFETFMPMVLKGWRGFLFELENRSCPQAPLNLLNAGVLSVE